MAITGIQVIIMSPTTGMNEDEDEDENKNEKVKVKMRVNTVKYDC